MIIFNGLFSLFVSGANSTDVKSMVPLSFEDLVISGEESDVFDFSSESWFGLSCWPWANTLPTSLGKYAVAQTSHGLRLIESAHDQVTQNDVFLNGP